MTDQAFTGWLTMYKAWLETNPPIIEIAEVTKEISEDL
jgi:hypothetical protein